MEEKFNKTNATKTTICRLPPKKISATALEKMAILARGNNDWLTYFRLNLKGSQLTEGAKRKLKELQIQI